MATTSKKMMITDVFVNGAFQGWNIATHSTIPNVLMAFVIIKMLNISGALDFIGTCLGPVRSARRSCHDPARRLDVHGRRCRCCSCLVR